MEKALKTLKDNGFKINQGVILIDDSLPWQHPNITEAIDCLCVEWDYCCEFILEETDNKG